MKLIQTILFICLISQQTAAQTKEIDKGMITYDQFVLRGEYDSIANMFTSNGIIQGEGQQAITGTDSIRKLLLSFKGASMIQYETVAKATSFTGNMAIQTGSYIQIVKIPSGDTLELAGEYSATWIKENNEWKIKKMYTHHYRNLKEERWITLIPNNSIAKNFVQALLKSGQKNASSLLSKMIRDSSNYYLNENEFNRLGYHLMAMNNKEESLVVFKITTELFPMSWNAYDSYGEALLQLGKREDAIKMYRKSIELNPSNTNGKLVLEKIEKN